MQMQDDSKKFIGAIIFTVCGVLLFAYHLYRSNDPWDKDDSREIEKRMVRHLERTGIKLSENMTKVTEKGFEGTFIIDGKLVNCFPLFGGM